MQERIDGSRSWLWAFLPLGASLVPGLWLLKWGSEPSTHTPPRPPSASERAPTTEPAAETPLELEQRELATPTAERAAHRLPARTEPPSQKGGGILRGDPMVGHLGAPVEQETTGWHGRLFAVWVTEGEDREATRQAADLLDELLAVHDIEPVAHFVGCGPSLCRARLRFHTLKDLHRMNKITPPDGIEVQSTFPARVNEDFVDVSLYWNGAGASLQEAAAAQEFFDTEDPWAGL